MTSIHADSVISAHVKINNYNDTERQYDITCHVLIEDSSERSFSRASNGDITSGVVNSTTGTTLATFQRASTITITYTQYATSDTQRLGILNAINDLLDSVDTFIKHAAVTVTVTDTDTDTDTNQTNTPTS